MIITTFWIKFNRGSFVRALLENHVFASYQNTKLMHIVWTYLSPAVG
jgi:hypothetical protein